MRWAILGLLVLCLVQSKNEFSTLEQRAEGVRPGKSFVFVVDQSGSMNNNKSLRAIEMTLMVASQPTDDMEACLIGFTRTSLRWKQGWKKLPSQKVVDDMGAWVKQFASNWAGTELGPALTQALAEEKKELTVVIISDGEFYRESTKALLAILEEGQKAREKKKLPRAVVMTIAVGKKQSANKLRALGKAGKGGCYLWTTKASKQSEKSTAPPK